MTDVHFEDAIHVSLSLFALWWVIEGVRRWLQLQFIRHVIIPAAREAKKEGRVNQGFIENFNLSEELTTLDDPGDEPHAHHYEDHELDPMDPDIVPGLEPEHWV